MGEIVPFVFKHEDIEVTIRVVWKDGNPWFVAADTCHALGLDGGQAQHTRRLQPDEKGVISIHTLGGKQRVAIISESGLYRLAGRSDKPIAKPFQDWVFGDVLPTIRRTGRYDLRDKDDALCGSALIEAVGQAAERAAAATCDRLIPVITNGFKETATALNEHRGQLSDHEQRLVRLEGKRRENFSEKTERYILTGLAEIKDCKCPYCDIEVLVTPYGGSLNKHHLHHADGNKRNNRQDNAMASCIECHKNLHEPNRRGYIPSHVAQGIALAFHRQLKHKHSEWRPPREDKNPWNFVAAVQGELFVKDIA